MLSFPPGAIIAGVPVTTLKAILKSIERTNTFRSAIELRSIGASQCDNAIAVEGAVHAGLVDPDRATLTHLGYAVLGSSSKARIPRAKAMKLLRCLLTAAERCNADPDRSYDITEIWLFGSLMRGAETVGDIDLAVKWEGRPGTTLNESDQRTMARFHQLYPDAGWVEVWDMAKRLQHRDLFGERRNSAYAFHRGIETIIAMAEPCMKVFSLAEGIVTAPVHLERHPNAKTRDESIRPRATDEDRDRLLTLQPVPRPLLANWSCMANGQWSPSPRMFALDPATSGYYHVARLVIHFESGKFRNLQVYAHDDICKLLEPNPEALPDTFNGRELALIVTDYKKLALQRGMDVSPDGTIIYNITLSDYVLSDPSPRKLRTAEVTAYEDIIGYYLATLVYADTLAIRRLAPSTEMIHFFSAMPGNEAIEARMRYWTAHLVKATLPASAAAA
ncbi:MULTISPECIES: hypothetical protein [unclassified Novosphingobium]|uniref:hypothetical protein n=1 Tax=unclassified Novosphingobium TaxID=2644732 RepID=UPI0013573289|nr:MULTISPECIES: hypothetical protein [unclassified Novosphingobium]